MLKNDLLFAINYTLETGDEICISNQCYRSLFWFSVSLIVKLHNPVLAYFYIQAIVQAHWVGNQLNYSTKWRIEGWPMACATLHRGGWVFRPVGSLSGVEETFAIGMMFCHDWIGFAQLTSSGNSKQSQFFSASSTIYRIVASSNTRY